MSETMREGKDLNKEGSSEIKERDWVRFNTEDKMEQRIIETIAFDVGDYAEGEVVRVVSGVAAEITSPRYRETIWIPLNKLEKVKRSAPEEAKLPDHPL